MRRELVPLALDAYPEAYEEFKRTMLVFVFGPEAPGSTVGELWADSTRGAVAAQLARTLRQAAGARMTSHRVQGGTRHDIHRDENSDSRRLASLLAHDEGGQAW